MEKDTLVLVLDPSDPEIFDSRRPAVREPVFGVVLEVLDHSGRSQEFRCRVRHGSGAEEVFPIGRLVPLLIVPEEDLYLTPRQIFDRWAGIIMKRQTLSHLPVPQRDFLYNLAVLT